MRDHGGIQPKSRKTILKYYWILSRYDRYISVIYYLSMGITMPDPYLNDTAFTLDHIL